MEPQVKLPRELEEEILSQLPPQSLVRFRSVCKRWNALLDEKRFINNHLSRSRPHSFIFLTKSKLYSIAVLGLDGVDPTFELCELPLSADFPDMSSILSYITAFDESLFCKSWSKDKDTQTFLWNPWLKQVELIEHNDTEFFVCGLGYNNTLPEKVYKILGYYVTCCDVEQRFIPRAAIYDCASHAFTSIDTTEEWPLWEVNESIVPFNGNLYWVTRYDCFIQSFDFSQDIFKPFCNLPCPNFQCGYKLVLAVFEGDRFSLFQNNYGIKEIYIWVTEKKIDSNNGGEVVWINLMTLSTSNLPSFSYNKLLGLRYFIYDKTLIMCRRDDYQTGLTYIYVLREDMFKVFQINYGPLHHCRCVYAPNFSPCSFVEGLG